MHRFSSCFSLQLLFTAVREWHVRMYVGSTSISDTYCGTGVLMR
jgi:hypothetical protein